VISNPGTSGATDLYSLSPDGVTLRPLTQTPLIWEVEPTWSPDHRQIAYRWLPESGSTLEAEIHIIGADGKGDRRLLGPGDLGPPAWSPDGKFIAFDQGDSASSRRRALMLIRPDGTDLHAVLDRGATDGSPAWSPNSSSLVFTSNCLANAPPCWVTTIWTVRLADTALRQLTFADPADSLGQEDSYYPQWSPDGGSVAMQHGSRTHVYVVPATGGPLTRVDTALTGFEQGWSPAWSPDGAELAFVGGLFSGPQLWLVNRDGSEARPIEVTIPGTLRIVRWAQ